MPSTCSTIGVSLAASDIGIDPPPVNKIKYTAASPHPLNKIYARPVNGSAGTIDPNHLFALFRIANWGSGVDWEAVPSGLQIWDKIPGDVTDPNPGHNDTPIVSGAQGQVDIDWTVGSPYLDRLATGDLWSHQCILVELSSDLPDLRLLNKSVYRNMDYALPMSEFKDDAEIGIVGLDSVPGMGPTRTVYLYVETKNMPRSIQSEVQVPDIVIVPRSPARLLGAKGLVVRNHRTVVGAHGATTVVNRIDTVPPAVWDTVMVPPRVSGEREQFLRTAEATGVLSWRELDALMPTYKVHAYHETGDSAVVNGVKLPIVVPQTSFGYWVDRRGAIRGWRHSLEGLDTQLDEIAPNFYKVSIRHHGSVRVRAVIKALEPLRKDKVLLLILIGLLVVALIVCWVKCLKSAPRRRGAQ